MRDSAAHLARLALVSTLITGEMIATRADAPLTLLSASTARCLDGSPGGYYMRTATNSTTANKWVFSLQGGGECVTEDDCAGRATSDLGSSTNWSSDGTDLLEQFQDSDPANPFNDWNHVFVMYCTGDLHLGTVETPGDDQWGWAYFSGALIVDAVIADLKDSHGLSNATEVIWSGDSAGGIGSAAHLDAVAQALPSTRVVGAPIAGFYWNNTAQYTGSDAIDYIPFDTSTFEAYYTLWQIRAPEPCASAYPQAPWTCALLNFSIPYMQSEIFVIEMETDSVQLKLHDGVPGYTNESAAFVLDFGRNMSKALWSQTVGVPRRGVFAAACYAHTAFYLTKPFIRDVNFADAFNDWMFNAGRSVYFDNCCSGDAVQFNPTC